MLRLRTLFRRVPQDAIRLLLPGDVHGYDPKEALIPSDVFSEFLARRRSCRWFTGEPVSEEEFEEIVSVADTSPTAENSQDVSIVILDRHVQDFMAHIRGILDAVKDGYPRIRQFCDYVDDGMVGNNPLIWEGKQLVLVFSKVPADALVAMGRMELMAYTMGLGGFYSKWIQMSEQADHAKLMEFFSDIDQDKGLQAVFVIGHPKSRFRRTVPRKKRDVLFM